VVVVVVVLLLVDVEVLVLVLVLVELLVVLVVGAAVVLVVVVLDVLVLLVVVVVGSTFTGTLTKFVHTPTDCTLIIVVPSGTSRAVYPAIKAAADTFVANGVTYPSVFE
jgi:ABC-type phosphate transport system substrate-binding protein